MFVSYHDLTRWQKLIGKAYVVCMRHESSACVGLEDVRNHIAACMEQAKWSTRDAVDLPSIVAFRWYRKIMRPLLEHAYNKDCYIDLQEANDLLSKHHLILTGDGHNWQ